MVALTSACDGAVVSPWSEHLKDGVQVLAVDKKHVLHRGTIVGDLSTAAENGMPEGYLLVELAASEKVLGLPEARLVPWEKYAADVLGEKNAPSSSAAIAQGFQGSVSIWRAEIWTEGLFSLLFWAIGWLESEGRRAELESPPRRLLIDWTDSRILFHGGDRSTHPNVWNEFFEQPRRQEGAASSASDIEAAEAAGRLSVSVGFGPPHFKKFGEFRGADEGNSGVEHIRGGRLDEALADAGRAAFQRWLVVKPRILKRAAVVQADLLTGLPAADWLAVHIRLTDKMRQCSANCLERDALASQIGAFSRALCCRGVFLCSDDVEMKRALRGDLERAGLRVAMHDALLSKASGQPSHKDEELDRRRNAEDVLVEAMIMARCRALLSTWSNVSVAAVYFSPPGYCQYMFGDAPPVGVTAVDVATDVKDYAAESKLEQRRCLACSAENPALRCSRCLAAYFCDAACQRSKWKDHKPFCVAPGA